MMKSCLKKTVGLVVTVLVFTGLGFQAASAEMPEVELSVDFASKYVWRGLVVTDDPVLQPGIAASMGGLTFDIWGNFDLTDINGESYRFTEIDYTLSYGYEVSPLLGIEAGAIYYTFPGMADDATLELFGSLTFDVVLQPTLEIYRDVKETSGWYLSLGIGHSIALSERFELSLAAAVGWGDKKNNDAYFGEGKDAMTDIMASASLNYDVAENIGLAVFLTYSDILDSGLRDAVDKRSVVVGGVGMVFGF